MSSHKSRRPASSRFSRMRPAPLPTAAAGEEVSKASVLSTLVLLVGVFITVTTLTGDVPSTIAARAAWGMGISLMASIAIDLRQGVRNLIRADVMALFSLYFLTLFEFLLPQSSINTMLVPDSVKKGCEMCAWGFAGLGVGRHIGTLGVGNFWSLFERPVSTKFIIKLFWFCFAVGYFHMIFAVNFDPIEMVSKFMEARFAQPWSRGRLGDWRALLVELGLFIYVIPPISGVVLARWNQYTKSQLVQVIAGFAFTLFYGFSSGTRNIFASYLVTFLIGYAFALPRQQIKRLLIVTGAVAVLLLLATRMMLEFRTMGLKYYLRGEMGDAASRDDREFFVDYNLYVICRLVEIFPQRYQYLGWEVPYLAVIRPIPRAIWPKKPEGLSISFEDAVGVEGLTLASSFIGEAYISFGAMGVFLTGAVFGTLFGWWSCLASPRNSEFGILVYASGFFAAVISMRSMFVFTTAVLPTVAAIIVGQIFLNQKQRASLTVGRATRPSP